MSLPWYKEGLRFQCTGCGKCCTGTSGYVWISEDEMREMANILNISVKVFKMNYVRQKDNRYALIEKKTKDDEYDCIFLENKQCKVYQARPLQCRTYPWWPENLTNQESWELAALECEGISERSPIVPFDEIEPILNG